MTLGVSQRKQNVFLFDVQSAKTWFSCLQFQQIIGFLLLDIFNRDVLGSQDVAEVLTVFDVATLDREDSLRLKATLFGFTFDE